jgi:hypothetical protein
MIESLVFWLAALRWPLTTVLAGLAAFFWLRRPERTARWAAPSPAPAPPVARSTIEPSGATEAGSATFRPDAPERRSDESEAQRGDEAGG